MDALLAALFFAYLGTQVAFGAIVRTSMTAVQTFLTPMLLVLYSLDWTLSFCTRGEFLAVGARSIAGAATTRHRQIASLKADESGRVFGATNLRDVLTRHQVLFHKNLALYIFRRIQLVTKAFLVSFRGFCDNWISPKDRGGDMPTGKFNVGDWVHASATVHGAFPLTGVLS